jgi:hypothetical protein
MPLKMWCNIKLKFSLNSRNVLESVDVMEFRMKDAYSSVDQSAVL